MVCSAIKASSCFHKRKCDSKFGVFNDTRLVKAPLSQLHVLGLSISAPPIAFFASNLALPDASTMTMIEVTTSAGSTDGSGRGRLRGLAFVPRSMIESNEPSAGHTAP